MSESFDDPLAALRREYLAELPARLEELRHDIAAFRQGQEGAITSLQTRFHRLSGSGGSYGFPEISAIARAMEQWIATGPSPVEAGQLDDAVARLDSLSQGPETPYPALPAGELNVKWRALLIVSPGPEREQLVPALEAAGYEVTLGHRRDDPASVSLGERPHLLVISTGPGEGDPSAVASSWTNGRSSRPRAVVLIETLRAVASLRAIAAGVDAVILAERMLDDLPRYARTLARIGPPPSRVLLVDPEADRAAEVARCLEAASIRVVRTPLAQLVPELLDRETPDLLLLGTGLPDAEAPAVATMVRQDPRFHLLPIVFLGSAVVPDQMEALRAGADDFLAFPAAPELILQTVISRAERGRRLREALYRDDLTGLLNHATLIAQLEYAVEHSRRHGGDVAFVVFDLDRFGEVNERFGQAVADQVLLHVATVFRSNVRASDVIGRYGGEEFGMILRGGGGKGASVLAAKLRRVLGEQAATTAEGVIIPLLVSVGWAAFPADGSTAPELVQKAVRALRKEKTEKT